MLRLEPYQSPAVTVHEVFLLHDLTPIDQVAFAQAFQVAQQVFGRNSCWCLKKRSHKILEGFSTVEKNRLTYKTSDIRPLALAMAGLFADEINNIAVRKSACRSQYCLNPSHYYWGTRQHVSYENAKRNGTAISLQAMNEMQIERDGGLSILKISRKYKVPYHTARRICNGEIYDGVQEKIVDTVPEDFWDNVNSTCAYIMERYSGRAKEFRLAYYVADRTECPWHQKGKPGHKGNFGLMGECLDCMEEVRNGRCTVDVTNFTLDWYWTVKRFWEQVDIRGEDECWPWLGTTRRDNTESIAYFPSPFHSGNTQSAPRVAFWLSRGYTGKYKVFSRPGCSAFCCNPTHLRIREFKDLLKDAKIDRIRLKHDDIFAHARKNHAQAQSDSAQ